MLLVFIGQADEFQHENKYIYLLAGFFAFVSPVEPVGGRRLGVHVKPNSKIGMVSNPWISQAECSNPTSACSYMLQRVTKV